MVHLQWKTIQLFLKKLKVELPCDPAILPLGVLLLSRFSRVQLCATPETAAHQAPRPWDSPGKNTGVSCHFLLQCMKVKSESEVAQSCPTLSNFMDCSLPGSFVHGIFQARVLEWGAIAFSEMTIRVKQIGNDLCPHGGKENWNLLRANDGQVFYISYTSWMRGIFLSLLLLCLRKLSLTGVKQASQGH